MFAAEYEFGHFRIPGDSFSPGRAASGITSFIQNNSVDSLPSLTEGMFGYSMTRSLHSENYHDGILDACEQFRCNIEEWRAKSGPGAFEAVSYARTKQEKYNTD